MSTSDNEPFTDLELDLMDELYFIKPCNTLIEEKLKEGYLLQELTDALWSLIRKGFIRSASVQDGQPHLMPTTDEGLLASHLLATKEGLLAIHLG